MDLQRWTELSRWNDAAGDFSEKLNIITNLCNNESESGCRKGKKLLSDFFLTKQRVHTIMKSNVFLLRTEMEEG